MDTFPSLAGITFPIKRTAIWSTVQLKAVSGRESPVARWTYPRWRWDLPFDVLRSAAATPEMQQLAGFFNAQAGPFRAFLYSDADDGQVTDQAFGTGDGTTKTFQLVRAFGGFTEPVFAATPTAVKVAGVTTTAYTLGSYGKITFTSAPAAGAALTWSGAFQWICRFDNDEFDLSKVMSNWFQADSLSFTSIKP